MSQLNPKLHPRPGVVYYLRPGSDPVFFPGMSGEIVLKREGNADDQVVGLFGVVHPDVLQAYEIQYPCSLLELDVEAIM